MLTALPCFNMLLKEIISKLSDGESIPDVPLVHGFIYEDQYFNMVTSTSSIAVHSETKAMTEEICIYCLTTTTSYRPSETTAKRRFNIIESTISYYFAGSICSHLTKNLHGVREDQQSSSHIPATTATHAMICIIHIPAL